MKARSSVILFCLSILAIVLLLFMQARHRTVILPVSSDGADSAQSVAPRTASGASNSVAASNVSAAPAPSNSTGAGSETKFQKMADILAAKNDAPIVFYGRLEDQFGNGVAGAQIAASIRIYNGTQSTVDRFSVESDANGQFQIDHGRGESLGLMPQKSGYALATSSTEFRYSQLEEHPYSPDTLHPTVIKMWKLQGAEPLASINSQYKFRYTGAPINLDLLSGQTVVSGGDIILTVTRAPGEMSGRNRLDWIVQIEAVDGGVMDSGGQEAVTYAAPESGYQQAMNFIFSTNAPHKWAGAVNQGIFFTSRNGQVYGKLSLFFRINEKSDDLIYARFSGIANTNHSRNWEGDPNTMK